MPSSKRGKAAAKTAGKQSAITALALPLLKNPLSHIGKQIDVLGAFWTGRQSAEEKQTLLGLVRTGECPVGVGAAAHRWSTSSTLVLITIAGSFLGHTGR